MKKREREILAKLRETLPKLDRENQKYVLGIAEGMAMVKPQEREEDKDAVCI